MKEEIGSKELKLESSSRNPEMDSDPLRSSDGCSGSNGHYRRSNGKEEKEEKEGLNKSEIIRIILQSLHHLGMEKSAQLLEEESGLVLRDPSISSFFESIEKGKWEEAKSHFDKVEFKSPEDKKEAKHQLFVQIYLELLDESKVEEALSVLRTHLAPYQTEDGDQVTSKLALLLICNNQEQLRERSNWSGTGELSRKSTLEQIKLHLSPRYLMKERRLEELLSQALEYQVSNCVFHNSSANSKSFSLYHDHSCPKSELPSKCINVLNGHHDEVWYLDFSHDGKRLASSSKDSTIIIWGESHLLGIKTDNEDLISLKGHTGAVSHFSWSPDDSKIVSCATDFEVKVWDANTGECLKTVESHSNQVQACSWLPDGERFITGGDDKVVFLHNLQSEDPLRVWRTGRVSDLVVSNDERLILLTEKRVQVVDLNDDKDEFEVYKDIGTVTSMYLSKDGQHLLVRNTPTEELHVWDLSEGKITKRYSENKQSRVVIHPCFGGARESFVVSGNEDASITIWHRELERHLISFTGHTQTVNAVRWSPINHKMFASCSDDKTIRIWS